MLETRSVIAYWHVDRAGRWDDDRIRRDPERVSGRRCYRRCYRGRYSRRRRCGRDSAGPVVRAPVDGLFVRRELCGTRGLLTAERRGRVRPDRDRAETSGHVRVRRIMVYRGRRARAQVFGLLMLTLVAHDARRKAVHGVHGRRSDSASGPRRRSACAQQNIQNAADFRLWMRYHGWGGGMVDVLR